MSVFKGAESLFDSDNDIEMVEHDTVSGDGDSDEDIPPAQTSDMEDSSVDIDEDEDDEDIIGDDEEEEPSAISQVVMSTRVANSK